jgi:hypothetical protein
MIFVTIGHNMVKMATQTMNREQAFVAAASVPRMTSRGATTAPDPRRFFHGISSRQAFVHAG